MLKDYSTQLSPGSVTIVDVFRTLGSFCANHTIQGTVCTLYTIQTTPFKEQFVDPSNQAEPFCEKVLANEIGLTSSHLAHTNHFT